MHTESILLDFTVTSNKVASGAWIKLVIALFLYKRFPRNQGKTSRLKLALNICTPALAKPLLYSTIERVENFSKYLIAISRFDHQLDSS